MLRDDPPAHKQQHEHWHERDRQQGAAGHGKGFRIGERFEQSSFLIFECEDRQKRDHDHEQAEEQRRPYFRRRRDECCPARLARFEALDMLVRVFDHDDCRVHHGTESNGDAAEAHDVGADAKRMHAGEGDEHADGQRENGDKRAPRMEKKQHAHGGHDQAFLDQRAREGVDSAAYELRTVIDRRNVHAIR